MILNKELHIKTSIEEEMSWNEKNMLELLNVKKLFLRRRTVVKVEILLKLLRT